MKFNHTPDIMASRSGPPHGKRSSLSRASSSRRKHGRAVTIEDALESEDHLHRVSGASTPGMVPVNEEVSPEWYTYTEGEPGAFMEANRGEEMPAQLTSEERVTAKKTVSGDVPTEEEPKATSNAAGEDQPVPMTNVVGTSSASSTGAVVGDSSPETRAAEQNHDAETPIPEAGRPPGLQWAEHAPPHHVFQSPVGPWAHLHTHGPPMPPQYRPIYPPPPPPISPPLFGMPHPHQLPPEGQVTHLEPRHLSGYELLASRLSGGLESGLPIPPIYRRFRELQHRILLELQDEIIVLEERLQQLDEQDSINRRYRDGLFLPASRRRDHSEPNEVTTARKQLLEHIAYKMFQFSKLVIVTVDRSFAWNITNRFFRHADGWVQEGMRVQGCHARGCPRLQILSCGPCAGGPERDAIPRQDGRLAVPSRRSVLPRRRQRQRQPYTAAAHAAPARSTDGPEHD